MKRNALNDSWEYVTLSKCISESDAKKNQTVYQINQLLLIVLCGIICLLIFSACGVFFEVLLGIRLPAVILGGLAFASIWAAKAIHHKFLYLFKQRFLKNGLRPFFTVKDDQDDPYIGQIFRDSYNRIVTICAKSDTDIYQTYYVKHGIQYQGDDIDKNHMETVEFLSPDAQDVKTDKITDQ